MSGAFSDVCTRLPTWPSSSAKMLKACCRLTSVQCRQLRQRTHAWPSYSAGWPGGRRSTPACAAVWPHICGLCRPPCWAAAMRWQQWWRTNKLLLLLWSSLLSWRAGVSAVGDVKLAVSVPHVPTLVQQHGHCLKAEFPAFKHAHCVLQSPSFKCCDQHSGRQLRWHGGACRAAQHALPIRLPGEGPGPAAARRSGTRVDGTACFRARFSCPSLPRPPPSPPPPPPLPEPSPPISSAMHRLLSFRCD
jgi:hypothetical protein